MYKTNILSYLEKRELGYGGPRKYVYDRFIDQVGYMPPIDLNSNVEVGNTFACKFSKNANHFNILGCSTECGEIIIQNTKIHHFSRNPVHRNAIFNFAWAEPEMKIVTACGDQTSKLLSLNPAGNLIEEREFSYNSSVKTVMFCPGSSDVFCGGCQDGSILIWDARVNNNKSDHKIPNAHGIYSSNLKDKKKMFGICSVIYKNDQTIMSSSSMDPNIKLWDLRKTYRQVTGSTEPLPLTKYFHNGHDSNRSIGYGDMITNPQLTRLYASNANGIIDCYSLESLDKKQPISHYKGHRHETIYSKISISYDGRYLFSGCMINIGVIWLTDFPNNEKPIFKISKNLPGFDSELSTSDWCPNLSCLKIATSADSVPMIWSILPECEFNNVLFKLSRTPAYKSKLHSDRVRTASIKYELQKKYAKETENNLKIWDIQNHNSVTNIEPLLATPKRQWEALFQKTTPPSPQLDLNSIHTSPVASIQIPDVVTPTSRRKRKKNELSPRCLIDQYLVSNTKRIRLDTVNENSINNKNEK